jgi:peptidoglycan hydrolase-like protein with peptidoglycan-binding domain
MNTSKINATAIALLTSITFLTGCGEEQKEEAKQTDRTVSESTPAPADSKTVNTATEVAGQTVEKTAETAQDLTSTSEIATTTVEEVVSDALVPVKTTPELVRKIQQVLSHAGFNPGYVDGKMGPKTMSALESFQKQRNLAVGQITEETLQALDIEK